MGYFLKIIVIEDSAIAAMDIQQILESFGYSVPLTIASGEEALERIIEIKPDLVLINIILSGEMDGIELAGEIQKMGIPIVFLTGLSEDSLAQRAELIEHYGYVTKPFDEEHLKNTIETTILNHKMDR